MSLTKVLISVRRHGPTNYTARVQDSGVMVHSVRSPERAAELAALSEKTGRKDLAVGQKLTAAAEGITIRRAYGGTAEVHYIAEWPGSV